MKFIKRIILVLLCATSAHSVSAAQGKVLSRMTTKLPTVATLKKAVTWKRAGVAGLVAATVLAYKYFIKTDKQIFRKFEKEFLDTAFKAAKSGRGRRVHAEKTPPRKALHWFGRPKYLTFSSQSFINFDRGDTHYDGSIVHTVNPGWFSDTHKFDARVTMTKRPCYGVELDDFAKKGFGGLGLLGGGGAGAAADVKRSAAAKIEVEQYAYDHLASDSKAQQDNQVILGIICEANEQLWLDSEESMRRSRILNQMGDSQNHTYVARDEAGVIVGFVTLKGNHILLLAVERDQRNRQIGSQMLCAVIDLMMIAGAEKITIDVQPGNARAKALYERCGFVFSGEQGAVSGLIRGTSNEGVYQKFKKELSQENL